ncbi:WSC domain protein [Rhodotorula toruloides]|uniref:WSC domain protein n=1 Tax=Rhodotorula toruloides TaxID=5286 RepID=A0A511KPE3_RHOTO|nr:WSC domain protein [Rhodotorula toruloides]
MVAIKATALALSLLCTVPGSQAFFRMPLDNPLIVERADPIISPGTVSGHVHTVSGSSNFRDSVTYEELRNSTCTSARAIEDKSAYYLFRNHPTDKYPIKAFPPGFRMVTGSPMLRTDNRTSGPAKDAIGWNCLGSASPTRETAFPKSKVCSGNLRGEIRFPSCWNGKDIYKSDGSHMAYSDGESGPCPTTHPHRLVTLFYEISYYPQALEPFRNAAMDPTQPFVLANGDPTGYGWHGDFFNGWDRQLLQKAVETCTADSGVIEECKIIKLYDRSDPNHAACRKTPDFNEVVLAPAMKALPGCNPITRTEEEAMAGMASCKHLKPPKRFKATVYEGAIPPVGAQVLPGTPQTVTKYGQWSYKGCFADNNPNRAFPKRIDVPKKTVQSCLDTAAAQGYGYAGIEYHGECWVGPKPSSAKSLNIGLCNALCDDDNLSYCGGGYPAAFSLYELKRKTSSRRHLPSDMH